MPKFYCRHIAYILISPLVCLILTSGLVFADPTPSQFTTSGQEVETKHIIPHLLGDEGYVEKYTFVAPLRSAETDGEADAVTGRLYFSLSVNNLGSGDHKLGAKGVIELGDQRYKWSAKRKKGKWKSSRSALDVKAGGVQLSGTRDLLIFKVKRGKGELEIKFKPITSTWRPSNGGLDLGKYRAEFSFFPLAEVTGSFTPEKGSPIKVKGLGWGRHTWSHLAPHEWSKWSRQVRVFDPEHKRALFIREIKTGGDVKVKRRSYAILIENGKKVFEGYALAVESHQTYRDKKHDNHYRFPTDFTITGTDINSGAQLTAKFKTGKRHYRRNPIAKFSWAKRKVIELATKPMQYAYEVSYDVKLTGSQPVSFSGEGGRYECDFYNK